MELASTLRPFTWTERTEADFTKLKVLFTSAPVLMHPDPTRQFVVEVEASDTGVGAILWMREMASCTPVHSCRFSPAEQNYDVGNHELLALIMALQEVALA